MAQIKTTFGAFPSGGTATKRRRNSGTSNPISASGAVRIPRRALDRKVNSLFLAAAFIQDNSYLTNGA
jgi:hypothetical protein